MAEILKYSSRDVLVGNPLFGGTIMKELRFQFVDDKSQEEPSP
jgi:hypothetical protein